MIRINKNLLKFVIVGLFLSYAVLAVFSKFIPLFLQHSVYFCQRFINSFSVKIPEGSGYILLGLLVVALLLITYKLLSIMLQIRRLRGNLIAYNRPTGKLSKILKELHLQHDVS